MTDTHINECVGCLLNLSHNFSCILPLPALICTAYINQKKQIKYHRNSQMKVQITTNCFTKMSQELQTKQSQHHN